MYDCFIAEIRGDYSRNAELEGEVDYNTNEEEEV